MREQTGGSHREQSQDADTVREALTGTFGYSQAVRDRALAALARLVEAAERTEAETKRADWLWQDCDEKKREIDAAEAERDAALARVELARRVTDAYTAEAEDHNDGEFALWKADDLINAIVALRIALGGPDA